ncbi:hypothetical protein ACFP1Z_31530 [Streptomyces gamaensis]|uniref:XRE family transcriptional regulator n=1 Tax=Streptomyces gamaensis TaxID=1763542 RepID=A0ABW0Z8H4_9ACTN
MDRLETLHDQLVAADDQAGGTDDVERRAAALAQEAITLQNSGSASGRVRSRLYAAAAHFTDSALWAAIDDRRLAAAEGYVNQAIALAALSGDPATVVPVWGHAGSLYRHLGRPADALAASEAARSTQVARSDHLYASLTYARLAVDQAYTEGPVTVRRSLDAAQRALSRTDPDPGGRPTWMRFFDRAELELLSCATLSTLRCWDQAEAHAHATLAHLKPGMLRNRALAAAYLARAQLHQGDAGHAVATARTLDPALVHGRTAHVLGDFTACLLDTAPASRPAREWTAHRKETLHA